MDKEFILERKELLHNFLRHVAKYKFFVESFEFGIFANFSGELLKKQAILLPKETPGEKLAKYQNICKIDLEKMTPNQKHRGKMAIEKFNLFVNTCL